MKISEIMAVLKEMINKYGPDAKVTDHQEELRRRLSCK